MKYSLRLQTFADVLTDVPHAALKVVLTGTKGECEKYAADNGFVWKDKPKSLFGGYWYKKPTPGFEGECLLPDTAAA